MNSISLTDVTSQAPLLESSNQAMQASLLNSSSLLPTDSATSWHSSSPPAPGLKAEYFDNSDFTNLKLTRTDATVNFDWQKGSPDSQIAPDTFSVRWTGKVKPLHSEEYTFYTRSDDGVRLSVNGQQLINNWTLHGVTENTGKITLEAGKAYDIKLEYYENGGKAVSKLLWSSKSQTKEVISSNQLFTPFDISTLPPAPAPAPSGNVVYLSDRAWTSVTSGWGAVEKDRSNGEQGSTDGKTLTLNGTTYQKGLGVHSDSEINYSLGGAYTRFTSYVGVDDEVGDKGSVAFQVWADGSKLYDSGTMTGNSETKLADVDLTGKQNLKLVVTNGDGDGSYDHADWANAQLTEKAIAPILTPPSIGSISDTSLMKFPLSTRGNQIIDATGQPIKLQGVNWFGTEIDTHVPHGLWVRDYKEMVAQIKQQGFNMIRLPFSVDALNSTQISGINFEIGNNKDLQGKTPLQVMDAIVAEAKNQGLMVLLDSHRLDDQSIPELWYDQNHSEADWINSWTSLAERYKDQPNVIGADLKNEPHDAATWGSNDLATDWRLAAERAGNAIHAVNPNWLIIVEGVQQAPAGKVENGSWWGGDLQGVGDNPVRLNVSNKVVYSTHEYGDGVYKAEWFNDPSYPNNLPARWETEFNYIETQNIAPVLVGEFGGRNVDDQSSEGKWQRMFVDFIKEKDLDFAYWSWNPNSGDTGGVLLDDWQTVDQPKMQLLSKILN